ncbi:MAG TPA: ammonium transporter [Stellaceae bacterium]|jgi:Amt family ammonium transporter
MALVPSPQWLNEGDNAWQLAAATFVALQSIPGLVVLYGGVVKKKWALNSAFMSIYAFASVLVVWLLWAYNMGFGSGWLGIGGNMFVGAPIPALSAAFTLGQATVPDAASGMPPMAFPMATLIYFQFVFAAITVIILAGSVLGRMSFRAWVIFCPVWMTLVYTVGAYSLWGGGWLAGLGAADFSGGYVIHLAAATSGFVAAAMVGPRLQADRDNFPPNSLLVTLVGAGILWLGWNGFNGGDPYFANADAGAAVLNTNTATAVALLVWVLLDKMAYGKPSVIGAVNGMIAGLVAITPGAGYVDGTGAIAIGIVAGIIPWLSMNKFQKTKMMMKVDDTLSVFSTHGVAGLTGGLLVGILANPAMLVYVGTEKDAPGVSITGLLYGDSGHQLLIQLLAAAFIICYNVIATFVILKVISFITPLRMEDAILKVGDDAVHGETAYAIGQEGE